jgi:Insertion element 4 transposase N-terminal
MAQNAGVAAGGRWTDQVSLGVLASSVPRDVIDDVVAAAGRQVKRSDGKLPPHVMVYFAMAMALFADDDYEEVAARLAGALGAWKCWDARWGRRPRAGSPGRGSGWAMSRWLASSPRWRAGRRSADPGSVPGGLAAYGRRWV